MKSTIDNNASREPNTIRDHRSRIEQLEWQARHLDSQVHNFRKSAELREKMRRQEMERDGIQQAKFRNKLLMLALAAGVMGASVRYFQ